MRECRARLGRTLKAAHSPRGTSPGAADRSLSALLTASSSCPACSAAFVSTAKHRCGPWSRYWLQYMLRWLEGRMQSLCMGLGLRMLQLYAALYAAMFGAHV